MPAPPGKVPILESARAGFAFARENIAISAAAAAIVAAPVALLETVAQQQILSGAPILGFAIWLASLYAGVFFHAALLRRALALEPGKGAAIRLSADEARLGVAIGVAGFFLAIVCLLPGVFVSAIAFAVLAEPFAAEIQAAAGDAVAQQAIAQKVMAQNPGATLAVLAALAFAWWAATSRLYLVAPATIAERRIRTLETWAWTKGNMLRIMAARLALLGPAFSVVMFAQLAIVSLTGGAAEPPILLEIGIRYAGAFVLLLVYSAAEAGLSAYLYRGLRPPAP